MMRATVMRRGGVATLALASLCSGAFADDASERWRFGDGESGQATAALLATNKLSAGGGALSYSPILTIACDPGGEPHWREWLWINDKISTDEAVTVRVTIDSDSFNERWAVRRGGKVLFRAGADGVAALASAGRLSVSWRFGFLSGRGEADFDLTGVKQAVGRIADACGTVPPS